MDEIRNNAQIVGDTRINTPGFLHLASFKLSCAAGASRFITSNLCCDNFRAAMSLLEAVHRVNVPRVTSLLFRGADVNMTDAQGVTPLIIACERGG